MRRKLAPCLERTAATSTLVSNATLTVVESSMLSNSKKSDAKMPQASIWSLALVIKVG